MQRVRIGLTGLGFVFLAVLLAAVFTGRAADEAPITPNTIEQQQAAKAPPPSPAPAEPAEPLATMKLAPGDSDANAAAPQPAPGAANPPAQR
jgi:hypothetical protein